MSPMDKANHAGWLIRKAGDAMRDDQWKEACCYLYDATQLLALMIDDIEQLWRRRAWQWCVN